MDSAAVPRNPADCRATLLLCLSGRKHLAAGCMSARREHQTTRRATHAAYRWAVHGAGRNEPKTRLQRPSGCATSPHRESNPAHFRAIPANVKKTEPASSDSCAGASAMKIGPGPGRLSPFPPAARSADGCSRGLSDAPGHRSLQTRAAHRGQRCGIVGVTFPCLRVQHVAAGRVQRAPRRARRCVRADRDDPEVCRSRICQRAGPGMPRLAAITDE